MSEYDNKASIMRRSWPTTGCCAGKKIVCCKKFGIVFFFLKDVPVTNRNMFGKVVIAACKFLCDLIFDSVEGV